jgi:hypothetical protein
MIFFFFKMIFSCPATLILIQLWLRQDNVRNLLGGRIPASFVPSGEQRNMCDDFDAGYRSIYNIAGPINIS